MRRLHPLAATAEVTEELNTAEAASNANRAPDGLDWTDLHIIQLVPSIIADYWLDCAGAASDGKFLDQYMRVLGDSDQH